MPVKKKTTITQEISGEARPQSFITQMAAELPKAIVTAAMAASFGLVVVYFTVQSLSSRVSALETESVRKDVLVETLEPMKDDIKEMKESSIETNRDVKDIKNYLLQRE